MESPTDPTAKTSESDSFTTEGKDSSKQREIEDGSSKNVVRNKGTSVDFTNENLCGKIEKPRNQEMKKNLENDDHVEKDEIDLENAEFHTPTGSDTEDQSNAEVDPEKRTHTSTKMIFEETDDGLKIKWTPIENFTKYLPLFERSDGEKSTNKKTQNHEYLFPSNVYNLNTGEDITVRLFAFDRDGKKHVLIENLQYVIGGKTVISQLHVEKSSKNPLTVARLTWRAPKNEPEAYKVITYKPDKIFVKEEELKNVTETMVDNLTPSTTYYFEVIAIYTNDKTGKPVRSLKIRTEDDPNAQQVEILKDMKARRVKVKWRKDKSANVSHYMVHLKSGENSEQIGECRVDETMNEVYFSKLKSDFSYRAHVATIETNNKVIAKSVSNPVTTNLISRNSDFDIKTKGKPIINACGTTLVNGNLESDLSWSIPDLGVESINFDCIKAQAFQAKIGKNTEKVSIQVQEKVAAKTKTLEFGTSYKFDVILTYRDLDSGDMKEATATKTLHTDISAPSELVTKLTNKEITVKWQPAKGATKHTLRVLDENEESIKDEIVCEKNLVKFSVNKLYGKNLTCVVKASGGCDKEKLARKNFVIGGDDAVTNVVASVSRRRRITVTWEPPKNYTNRYRIRLYYDQTKKQCLEKIHPSTKDQCSHTFTELKANTIYYCKVFAERDGKFKNGTYSNTVTTVEVKRNPNFDISSEGKPKIQVCKAIPKNEKYESLFKWDLANIGEEANSYVLETKAFVTVKGEKRPLVLESSIQAKPILLDHGESYEFCVSCTYRDLDDDTCCHLEDTCSLNTDIGTPIISDVTWKASYIIIEWQPAAGATKHVLSVFDDATKAVLHDNLKIDDHKHFLKMTDACGYGRTCNFVIQASNKKNKESKNKRKVLIGSDEVCTEVTAKKDAECPQRKVLVTWELPSKRPRGYKIEIHQKVKNDWSRLDSAIVEQPTLAFHKFEELKSDAMYICKVFPVYHDKVIGNGTSSNQLQTEPRKRIALEKSKNFGMPKNVAHTMKNTHDGSIVEISWDELNVGENFRLDKYHVHVYEPGRIYDTHHLKDDYGPRVTKVATKPLAFGKKFFVEVSATYIDLDTQEKKTGVNQISFSIKPNTPQLKDCICKDQYVTFYWDPIDNAEKYQILVKDFESNTVADKTISDRKAHFEIPDELQVGKTYQVTLYADSNNVKSEPCRRNYLIGGDNAVEYVVAKKDEVVPRREIVVEWKPPKLIPEGYQVEIHEVDTKFKKIRTINTPEKQAHKFTELKTNTFYKCKVSPIYNGFVENGSYSDMIKTDKRFIPAFEKTEFFGTPETISDNADKFNPGDSLVVLSWSTVNAGENYKIKKFSVTVKEHEKPENILSKEIENERKLNVQNLKEGHTYDVKFTTVLIDLDSREKKEKHKDHTFSLRTSTTNVKNCETEKGLVTFTWDTVDGAHGYCLVVKDESLENTILEKTIGSGNLPSKKAQIKGEISEQLCIGRTCMTKVITHGNGFKSESDWKPYLIGGELVPRNVKASEYTTNPQRCIQVTFDAPKIGVADKYKVVIDQGSKAHKTDILCKNSPVVVEYLRQGFEYSFSVSALFGDKWSEMSSSNFLRTKTKQGNTDFHKLEDVGTATINMQNANLTGGTNIEMAKGVEFDQVRDLDYKIKKNVNTDFLQLEWKVPKFGDNSSDYKVENYKGKISKIHSSQSTDFNLDFVKGKNEYCEEVAVLELGETYEISISTIYIDIDEDKECTSSSAKKIVATRPCQPDVIRNEIVDEKLKLEWNHANGAKHYIVEVFTNDSDKPIFKSNTGEKTSYERRFNDTFGFGKTYFVVVEAVGSKGRKNSFKTKKIIIGEDRAPSQLKANISHSTVTDPSTQVHLEWTPPKKSPVSYEVMFSSGEKCESKFQGDTKCIVSGLDAGTHYIFQVFAIHKDVNGEEKRSGGCLSDKIATSPKPTQVQNVKTALGRNPCTSIAVKWDNVNVGKNDEVKYRVTVMTLDTEINKIIVKENHFEICGLEPDTFYSTTVAGGNSEGFGRDSKKSILKTASGKPTQVRLTNSEDLPSTALVLQFTAIEGETQKYSGTLYEGQTAVSPPREVHPGYVFKELHKNTRYHAEMFAVFATGEEGMPVKSIDAITAPGKPEITKYGCCSKNEEFSSRDLFLKWKAVDDLCYYEVQIIFERSGKTEKEIIVRNKNGLTYSCQHESCQYIVQVRAKNEVFGDWSDKKLINLGPSVLKNITAELSSKSNNIIIRCERSIQGTLQYYMQAFCKENKEGNVQKMESESVPTVSFSFVPQQPAEQYSFQLWAEKPTQAGNLNGKRATSNTVISKPEKVQNVLVTPSEENPNMKTKISWNAVERRTYELLIQRTDSKTRECLTKVKGGTYEYTCCHAEDEYNVFVRGLCESVHGDWSDGTKISLEPPPLQNITAVLDSQSKDINIHCRKSFKGPLLYCMQALCNGDDEGNVLMKDHCDDDIVEFSYTPQKCAEIYSFRLWVETPKNVPGKKACSNNVISEPAKIRKILIEPTEDHPSARVKISWDKLERCDVYEVDIRCAESEHPECTMKVENTSCKYVCSKPGEQYIARVRGLREHTAGEWSDNFTTCLAPTKVDCVDVNITTNPNNVRVSWKPLDKAPTDYVVALYQGEEKIWEEITSATQCEFKNKVKPGYMCYCTVAGNNSGGRGKIRKSKSHRFVSAMVENLRSKIEAGNIIYEWDPVQPTPDEYVLKLRVNNDTVTEETTEDTSFKWRLLEGAQSYELSVAASNSAGTGKMTRLETIVPVCDRVANLRSRLDAGNIIYEWDCLEPTPDKYVLRWKVDNELITEESTEETLFKRRVVNGAQSYELHVAGSNSAGIGKMTKLEIAVPVPAMVPNLRSRLENGNIIYQWDSLDSQLDEYFVQWNVNNGEAETEDTTEDTIVVKRLVKGAQSYKISVAASNSAGKGKFAQLETFVPVPELVENLRSKEENGAVVYEWDALDTPPNAYIVQWRVNNELITEESTEETYFQIRFLKPAHSYNLRVMASNIAGCGKMTKWHTFITAPLPPRNLIVKSDDKAPQTSFIVKYEDDIDPLKEYKVTAVAKEGGIDVEKKSVKTKTLRAHITGLEHGRSYFIKVQTIFCEKVSEDLFFMND